MTDAPERIWIDACGGKWSPVSGGTQREEYIRAGLVTQRTPDPAPTFTAADLERAWGMGRDYVCNMVPSNWDMTRIAMKSPPADLAQRVKE